MLLIWAESVCIYLQKGMGQAEYLRFIFLPVKISSANQVKDAIIMTWMSLVAVHPIPEISVVGTSW